jgi:hypothetical protein
MTAYLDKFVSKMISHYIPEGIDELTHINSREFMYDLIMTLLEEEKIPLKLSTIKYLLINYKTIINSKLSVLN